MLGVARLIDYKLILTCFIKKDQEKCITIAVKALIYSSSFSNIVMYSFSMSMVFGTHFHGLAVVKQQVFFMFQAWTQ